MSFHLSLLFFCFTTHVSPWWWWWRRRRRDIFHSRSLVRVVSGWHPLKRNHIEWRTNTINGAVKTNEIGQKKVAQTSFSPFIRLLPCCFYSLVSKEKTEIGFSEEGYWSLFEYWRQKNVSSQHRFFNKKTLSNLLVDFSNYSIFVFFRRETMFEIFCCSIVSSWIFSIFNCACPFLSQHLWSRLVVDPGESETQEISAHKSSILSTW